MDYYTILLRTCLAVVLGGVVGLERQSKHRPAGFRTHILVCLGSATVMALSEFVFSHYHHLYGADPDPMRFGAQVISGIGFLGAGTIIHYGTSVKGLTTAASLWAVAAVGLTVGAGHYQLAVTVTAVLYITLFIFSRVSKKINKIGNSYELLIRLENKPQILGAINMLLDGCGAELVDMIFTNPAFDRGEDYVKKSGTVMIRIIFKLKTEKVLYELIGGIGLIEGVFGVERI